ncbi:MAG TPA: type II secretion system protein N [Guyparkeria sp.]|nr:type II secretion system protein N [Guyparkeria sp.]
MPAASALDRLTVWGPLVVAAFLVLLLGVTFARLTWTLLSPGQPVVTAAAPADALVTTHAPDPLRRLDALAPFGTAAEAPSRQITGSTLNVRLRGLITGPTPLAMIEIPGGVKVLQTGDTIRDGVAIHAIDGDRIVVDNNGRLESITLPGATKVTLDQAPEPDTQGALPHQSLKSLLADPRQLLDHVNMAAVQRDGQVVGYRINSRPGRAGLLTQVGLHEGDMITHLDGAPLADPGNLARLMGRLASGEAIEVRVERGGERIETTLDTGAF